LKYIGGTYGGNKHPTDFVCLILKMLQIQPSEEIITEYLSDDCADYKYLRALAAFYVRLTCKSSQVYLKLEQLLNDYRKLRLRNSDGCYSIIHMDEYIEFLLNKEEIFEITLPKLPKRKVLEVNGELQSRVSILEADLDLENLMADSNQLNKNYDNEYNDINLDKLKESSESSSDSENDIKNKPFKKRRIDQTKKDDNEEITIETIKNLDPQSNEYWLAMRKIAGIK